MDRDDRYGMKTMHGELLSMLESFDQFCRQHDIRYSLGFGSMLGAVREHGIIPWDDDIDLIIDRGNYRRLREAIKSSEDFTLLSNNKEVMWIPRVRRKAMPAGQFAYTPTIDLFLVDHVPDSALAAKCKLLMVLILHGMVKNGQPYKTSLARRVAYSILHLVGCLFPMSFKFWLLEKVYALSNGHKTRHCAIYNVEVLYAGRRLDAALMDEMTYMPFDHIQAPVSKKYDSCLTTLYGDYMTPPQKKKQIPKHSVYS